MIQLSSGAMLSMKPFILVDTSSSPSTYAHITLTLSCFPKTISADESIPAARFPCDANIILTICPPPLLYLLYLFYLLIYFIIHFIIIT